MEAFSSEMSLLKSGAQMNGMEVGSVGVRLGLRYLSDNLVKERVKCGVQDRHRSWGKKFGMVVVFKVKDKKSRSREEVYQEKKG